jgi:hypothetical protein
MLHADLTGIVALIAVAMSCALAVVLFRVGGSGSVARKLALLLVVEAAALASSSSIDLLLAAVDVSIAATPPSRSPS